MVSATVVEMLVESTEADDFAEGREMRRRLEGAEEERRGVVPRTDEQMFSAACLASCRQGQDESVDAGRVRRWADARACAG